MKFIKIIKSKKLIFLALSTLLVTACGNNFHNYEKGRILKNCSTHLRSVDKSAKLDEYLPYISSSAKRHNITPQMIATVIDVESGWYPKAVSKACALGLMQIIQKSAGKDIYEKWGMLGVPSVEVLFDPKKNIEIGTRYLDIIGNEYLKELKRNTPKEQAKWIYLTFASYKAGIGSVRQMMGGDFSLVNKMPYSYVRELIIKQGAKYDHELVYHMYKMEQSWKKYRFLSE